MSDSLTFDLIVKDDSERGLNKFAKNLEKAGKNGQAAGRHVADGMSRVKEKTKEAESETDRLNSKFEKLKKKASEANEKGLSPLGLGLVALGPAAVPIATAAIPAVIGLGAAFAGAGAAVGVFKAVFSSTLSEVQDQAKDLDDMQDKIKELGDTAKLAGARGDKTGQSSALDQQKIAIQQYQAALKAMDPDQRKAVAGYRVMKNVWQQFVDINKPATYSILARGYTLIKAGIGELQPLFDVASDAAVKFLRAVQGWVDQGGLKGMVDFLATQGAQTISKFQTILTNLATGFAPLFRLSSGAGQGLLTWITNLSTKFAAFGAGGGWERFISYTTTSGPGVMAVLTNLATTAGQLVTILTPFAPISLAIAGGLTAIIAAVPPGVITTMLGLFLAYSAAMKVYAAYTLIAAGVTKAQAIAQWALNSAILANPITWIVIGIVALIAVIVLIATKTKIFQTVWKATWAAAKVAFKAVVSAIKAVGNGLFIALKLYLKIYIGFWKLVFNTVKTVAVGVFHAVRDTAKVVWSAITDAVRTAVSRIKTKIQDIRTKAGTVLSSIKKLFSPNALFDAGKQLIEGLAKGILKVASKPVDAVKGIVSNIKGFLPGSPIKHGPLKSWNNGKAGVRLMKLLSTGILAGKGAVAKAVATAVKVRANAPSGSTAKKISNPGARTALAVAGVQARSTKLKMASRSTELRRIGFNPVKSGKSTGKGSSGGGGGGLTVNFYGVQYGTPEQISKAVIGALRQFKASGGTVPFGTFQGGSV